jgi:hypothetical protein
VVLACTQRVEAFYKEQHSKQTYDFVVEMEQKYATKMGLCKMGLWECLEYLDQFVDDSDPDTENSQVCTRLWAALLSLYVCDGWCLHDLK